MNKSKKYHLGLLVVAVIVFFSFTSVNASDNFVKISLPKGVSIELPKNWIVLSNNQRIDIDTFAESALDLADIEYVNSGLPFAANYYKNDKIVGIIQTRYYPNLDLTQNDSRQATLQDINELNATLKENTVKSMKAGGMSVLSWTGTKKNTINGITAFVTEYRRKEIKVSGAFRVRLIRVYAGDRSFTLIVSYSEEEAFFLKIITDRIISSLKLSGINEATTNSQVYTKSISNTDSVMSQGYGVWVIMLALAILYTWGIGLTPPLLIRFLFVRRPISKGWAIGTAVIFWFINITLFTVLNLILSNIKAINLILFKITVVHTSKSHGELLLVAAVSYLILRKKLKHKSQSEKEPKKKRGKYGWMWVLFGLLCIYLIGMLVVFNNTKSSIPFHYKVLGEMAELSGFVIPLLSTILIFTAVGFIPFLFFKRTRQWKTPIYILLIISGWQYGEILAGNFYLNFLEMKISNSRIFAFGILFLYLTVFVSIPIIVLQWLKNNKWKHFLWLLPLVFLYMGLKINAQMNPIPAFNSTLKPYSLIHLEGGLRDGVSRYVADLLKDNPDIKEITLDSESIEDVILSPAVADADRIFKENSKAVVVVTAYDEKGNAISRGSGFIVRADGAVVTNYHVIGMARDIKVKAGDKVLDVEGLIFTDEENDLVILKAKAKDMPVVKLGVVDKANIGEHVYIISSVGRLENTISDGLLSGIIEMGEKREILQMTAAFSHGSSGGPVFNRNGEVIGVATYSSGFLLSGELRNLSFAMPVKLIKDKISSKMVTTIKESGLEDYENTAMYWFHLGGTYSESGRYEEAILSYKMAIKINPDYVEAHSNLGDAYGNLGMYKEEIQAWKQAIRIDPENAYTHFGLGLAYYKSGKYKEAILSYKMAIKINPDFAMAHYNLGGAYYKSDMLKEGIDACKQAIRIDPDLADAHSNLGVAYGRLGMHEEAIEAYKQAIKINPDFAMVHHNLGGAYYKSGKYKEAILSYKMAIKINPDFAMAHSNLGDAYIKSGKYEEAIEAYKQTIKINPDNAEAYVNLGAAYGMLGKNKEAIEACKQAIKINPDDADTHVNLGVVYHESGRHKEAIASFKQAISIDSDLVEVHYVLGVVYAFLNDKDSALEQYKILKNLDPKLANKLFNMIYK